MTVQSMTGFSRSQGAHESWSWIWELKSVNGRGLDVRSRLPHGFDAIEQTVRTKVGAALKRGNLNISLNVEAAAGKGAVRMNPDALAQLPAFVRAVAAAVPDAAPARVDGLLALRWLVEADSGALDGEDRDGLLAAVLADIDAAIAALVAARRGEGDRLAVVLAGLMDDVDGLRKKAAAAAETQGSAIREKLARQITEVMAAKPDMPEERLAQEAALLMTKADVREELDRLAAHVAAGRDLLGQGGVIGRKLDFLCQEFNREANTLCSKAQTIELTNIGLALKAVIDQIREQVQNIE